MLTSPGREQAQDLGVTRAERGTPTAAVARTRDLQHVLSPAVRSRAVRIDLGDIVDTGFRELIDKAENVKFLAHP